MDPDDSYATESELPEKVASKPSGNENAIDLKVTKKDLIDFMDYWIKTYDPQYEPYKSGEQTLKKQEKEDDEETILYNNLIKIFGPFSRSFFRSFVKNMLESLGLPLPFTLFAQFFIGLATGTLAPGMLGSRLANWMFGRAGAAGAAAAAAAAAPGVAPGIGVPLGAAADRAAPATDRTIPPSSTSTDRVTPAPPTAGRPGSPPPSGGPKTSSTTPPTRPRSPPPSGGPKASSSTPPTSTPISKTEIKPPSDTVKRTTIEKPKPSVRSSSWGDFFGRIFGKKDKSDIDELLRKWKDTKKRRSIHDDKDLTLDADRGEHGIDPSTYGRWAAYDFLVDTYGPKDSKLSPPELDVPPKKKVKKDKKKRPEKEVSRPDLPYDPDPSKPRSSKDKDGDLEFMSTTSTDKSPTIESLPIAEDEPMSKKNETIVDGDRRDDDDPPPPPPPAAASSKIDTRTLEEKLKDKYYEPADVSRLSFYLDDIFGVSRPSLYKMIFGSDAPEKETILEEDKSADKIESTSTTSPIETSSVSTPSIETSSVDTSTPMETSTEVTTTPMEVEESKSSADVGTTSTTPASEIVVTPASETSTLAPTIVTTPPAPTVVKPPPKTKAKKQGFELLIDHVKEVRRKEDMDHMRILSLTKDDKKEKYFAALKEKYKNDPLLNSILAVDEYMKKATDIAYSSASDLNQLVQKGISDAINGITSSLPSYKATSDFFDATANYLDRGYPYSESLGLNSTNIDRVVGSAVNGTVNAVNGTISALPSYETTSKFLDVASKYLDRGYPYSESLFSQVPKETFINATTGLNTFLNERDKSMYALSSSGRFSSPFLQSHVAELLNNYAAWFIFKVNKNPLEAPLRYIYENFNIDWESITEKNKYNETYTRLFGNSTTKAYANGTHIIYPDGSSKEISPSKKTEAIKESIEKGNGTVSSIVGADTVAKTKNIESETEAAVATSTHPIILATTTSAKVAEGPVFKEAGGMVESTDPIEKAKSLELAKHEIVEESVLSKSALETVATTAPPPTAEATTPLPPAVPSGLAGIGVPIEGKDLVSVWNRNLAEVVYDGKEIGLSTTPKNLDKLLFGVDFMPESYFVKENPVIANYFLKNNPGTTEIAKGSYSTRERASDLDWVLATEWMKYAFMETEKLEHAAEFGTYLTSATSKLVGNKKSEFDTTTDLKEKSIKLMQDYMKKNSMSAGEVYKYFDAITPKYSSEIDVNGINTFGEGFKGEIAEVNLAQLLKNIILDVFPNKLLDIQNITKKCVGALLTDCSPTVQEEYARFKKMYGYKEEIHPHKLWEAVKQEWADVQNMSVESIAERLKGEMLKRLATGQLDGRLFFKDGILVIPASSDPSKTDEYNAMMHQFGPVLMGVITSLGLESDMLKSKTGQLASYQQTFNKSIKFGAVLAAIIGVVKKFTSIDLSSPAASIMDFLAGILPTWSKSSPTTDDKSTKKGSGRTLMCSTCKTKDLRLNYYGNNINDENMCADCYRDNKKTASGISKKTRGVEFSNIAQSSNPVHKQLNKQRIEMLAENYQLKNPRTPHLEKFIESAKGRISRYSFMYHNAKGITTFHDKNEDRHRKELTFALGIHELGPKGYLNAYHKANINKLMSNEFLNSDKHPHSGGYIRHSDFESFDKLHDKITRDPQALRRYIL